MVIPVDERRSAGDGEPLPDPDLEIGWWLARPHWGRGLATEAAKAALHDIFERVGLGRVISIARRSNTASTRIMEKIGLQFQREFESGGVHLVRYAIDREQYAVARRNTADPRIPE